MTIERPLDLDGLSLRDVRRGVLRDRPITVLGLARSGIALARFFSDSGARVTVYDGRPADALRPAIEALGSRPIELALGPDVEPASTWSGAALVATSPSINPDYPTTEPRLRAALRTLVASHAADPGAAPGLVSEADLTLRLCPAPTIGVTGTKGKTTTASLIATILEADPAHPVVLGGNIGIPLVERLPELTPDHRVVIELSELQLPTLARGTTVAVYTNVTSDHLDRHGSLEAYRRVKRRLAELVDPAGAVVLNADDPVVSTYADGARARVVDYRLGPPLPGGVGVVDGSIVSARVGPLPIAGRPSSAGASSVYAASVNDRVLPLAEIAIPGRHNVSNVLAGVAVGLLFGVPLPAIREAVAAFRGVEHRLELVATIDGVRFVNDSQGTQPDAVIAALRSFESPVVLIAGGRDKDIDLSALPPVVAARAAAAVLIGESGPRLEALFRAAGLQRTERAATLDEAVRGADELARGLRRDGGAGQVATVLLSPAAASFDMFVDYEARGREFKRVVAELARERGAGEAR